MDTAHAPAEVSHAPITLDEFQELVESRWPGSEVYANIALRPSLVTVIFRYKETHAIAEKLQADTLQKMAQQFREQAAFEQRSPGFGFSGVRQG